MDAACLFHLLRLTCTVLCSEEARLSFLVRDGEVVAGGSLVFVADEIGDGLVLGLLGRRLIALIALAEELFLDKIDGLMVESAAGQAE